MKKSLKRSTTQKHSSSQGHVHQTRDFKIVVGLALILLGVLIITQMITTGYHAQLSTTGAGY